MLGSGAGGAGFLAAHGPSIKAVVISKVRVGWTAARIATSRKTSGRKGCGSSGGGNGGRGGRVKCG